MSFIKRGRSVLLLALALLAARAQGANFNAGDLTGNVTFNGAPVSGALATSMYAYLSNGAGTYLGGAGTYSLLAVTPGDYTLKLYPQGCFADPMLGSAAVTITAASTTTQDFDLTAVAGKVTGTITVNGAPLANPTVTLQGTNCGGWPSDSSGKFQLLLPPGSYTAKVAGANGALGTFDFTVTAGATNDVGAVDFTTGTLSGTVSYQGAPISGGVSSAMYLFLPAVGNGMYLSSSGTYSLASLPPASYVTKLYPQGCFADPLLLQTTGDVTGGAVTTLDLDLTPVAGLVKGKVTVNGVALANPTVIISGTNCGGFANDGQGNFSIFLTPGTYTLKVSSSTGALGTASVTVMAGQTSDLGTVNFTTGDLSGTVSYKGAAVPAALAPSMYLFLPALSNGTYLSSSATYAFSALVPQDYQMKLYPQGCFADPMIATATATVVGTQTTTQDFDLTAAVGVVSGTITVNGAPLANPTVTLQGTNCGGWPSDAAGHFQMMLTPGSYVAKVSGPSGLLGTFPFSIAAGQSTQLDLGSTPVGSNVLVDSGGGLNTAGGIEIAFATVTAPGSTSITTGTTGPSAPAGFRIVTLQGNRRYWDVSSSATYSTPVSVCVRYDPADVIGLQSRLSLRDATHSFADLTTSVDAGTHVVCGAANTLSQFAVLEPLPSPTLSPTAAAVSPRQTQQFTASGGSGAPYTYAVSPNNSGGTIDGTGLYTAGALGGVTDTVTVTDSASMSASATVTVASNLVISPGSMNIAPKGTVQFHATGGDGTDYRWTIKVDGSGASINAEGVYTGGPGPNTTDVVQVADLLGNTATVTLTVGPGITLSPSSITLAPRASQKFTAVGGSGAGYTWKLTDTSKSGGSVDPKTGAYTAGNAGTTSDVIQCTDSFGNIATAAASVTAGVSITPPSGPVSPRSTLTLVASGGSGSGFTWVLVSTGSGATLSDTGVYLAGPTGGTSDVIKVTDPLGNTFFLTINVAAGPRISPLGGAVAPRGRVNLSASGGSGGGYTYLLTTNGSNGSVDRLTGVYTAGSTGGTIDVVTVTDALGNSSTASFNVSSGIVVSPRSASVVPKATAQLGVTGGGGAPYTWSISPGGSHGSITQAGLYTAGSTGSTSDTVTVADGLGNSGTAVLFVSAGVTVSPDAASVAPLAKKQLQAAGGSGLDFKWALLTDGSGASLSTSGLYTAGAKGSTTDVVKATDSLGNTGTSTLTVTAGVSITPAVLAVSPRKTQQFSAAGGSNTAFVWALLTSGSAGSITADGFYAAGPKGSTTDTVQVTDSLGNTASLVVTVNAALTATPSEVTVAPRQPATFTAAGGSSTGFSWAVAINGSGSTIDAVTGAYTAGPKGGVVELVTCTDSLSNVASVIVTVGPGVTVTPAFANVAPRGTQQLTARGGNGAYTYAIVSTNGSGGTISAAGLYTAGSTADTVDTIKVTDVLGNFALGSMSVTDALSVLPNAVTVAPRSSRSFSAAGGAGGGFTWSLSTNGSGATVTASTDGVTASYTAGARGNATDVLTVTDGLGNVAMGTITVGQVITVTPATASLAPRAQQKLTATGGLGTYRWRVLPGGTSGGSVSSTGIYTAGTADTSKNTTDTVEVSDALGNTATAVMTVTTGLVVTPAGISLAPRASQVFTAAGGTGTQISFTLSVNQSGGSVSTEGRYLAGPRGGATDVVKASDNLGNSASATVTVTAGLVVNPETSTLPPKGKQQLTATGGNGIYTWTLLPTSGSGGTVSTSGLYTAGPAGVTTDTVQVTDSVGNSATASFNVTVGLSLTPDKASVAAKTGKATFTAAGGAGPDKGYTWTVSTNLSGGSVIDGNYSAGNTGNVTDVVQVVDAVGNVATANVVVAPIPAAATGCSTAEGSLLPQLLVAGLGLLWRRRRARIGR